MDDLLNFNGIDAISGEYLLPAIEPKLFSKVIEGVNLDPKEVDELKNWYFSKTRPNMGLRQAIHATWIRQVGGLFSPAAAILRSV